MQLIPANTLPSPVAYVIAALFDHAMGKAHTSRRVRKLLGCADPMCAPKKREARCVHCGYATRHAWNLKRHIGRVHHGAKRLRDGELKARR